MNAPHRVGLAASIALHALAMVLLAPWHPPDAPRLSPPLQIQLRTEATAHNAAPPARAAQPAATNRVRPHARPREISRAHQAAGASAPHHDAPADSPQAAAEGPTMRAESSTSAEPTMAHASPMQSDTPREHRAPRVEAAWAGNVPPPYPIAARRLGEQGTVHFDVHVGADGSVLALQLRRSSGSPRLDRSALETLRRWRFTPAQLDGQPIAAWYQDWQWVFRLDG